MDPNLVGDGERFTNNIKGLRAPIKRLEGGRDIPRLPDFQRDRLDAERAGRGLDLIQFPHARWIVGIGDDRQLAETGHDLAQEFQALARKLGRRKRQAGDVATRPRQTGDEASAKRVRHRREHDWDNRGRLFRCEDRRSRCDNNIDLETDKLGGDLGETLEASLRPTNLDHNGTALDPSEFAQPLLKSGDPLARGGTRLPAQKPDGRQLARLLRPRRERPRGRRAAEQRHELAASHSITSSARASSDGGTVRPIAFAAITFSASSNLVGCSTGKSPGFAPRRILSTYSAARRNRSALFAPYAMRPPVSRNARSG